MGTLQSVLAALLVAGALLVPQGGQADDRLLISYCRKTPVVDIDGVPIGFRIYCPWHDRGLVRRPRNKIPGVTVILDESPGQAR